MISDKILQKKIEWFPHAGQKGVLACKNNEIIICAGRRWGKSAVCGYIIVREFLNAMIQIKAGKKNSYKVWIVAPTYELSNKVFEYVVKFLLAYDRRFGQYVQSRPQAQIKLSESVWIQCKSTTEPFGLLGEELDLQIIDEAARIPEKIFNQYIYPTTIAKSRDCRTYMISTPKGKNWFQKKFYILKDKAAAFRYTTLDGVETDEDKLEEIKIATPELLFNQEYLAMFIDEAGSVFRDVDKIIAGSPKEAESGHFYTMGVDLAQSQDFTCITVVDRDTHEVVHFDRFKGRDYPLQKQQIIAKAQRYNNARVVIDSTGVGRGIYDDLRQSGIFIDDFTFSGKSKPELIGKLIVSIEEKYITIPSQYQLLIDELKAFEYQYINEKTGEPLKNIKYEAPRGYHDDGVDSLAMAVWGINLKKPIKQESPVYKMLKAYKMKKSRDFI